jgi:hypothetical protein
VPSSLQGSERHCQLPSGNHCAFEDEDWLRSALQPARQGPDPDAWEPIEAIPNEPVTNELSPDLEQEVVELDMKLWGLRVQTSVISDEPSGSTYAATAAHVMRVPVGMAR